ncbi:hypothetical protein [Rhodobacteraceae bacterium DSL-40]|uniref:hypothetical protein n=1 Tax=Amaricoccus sp. B4 TaxID=3368557 RepID=UPI0013A6D207
MCGKLRLKPMAAAFDVVEVVDDSIADAARVHSVENGKNISGNAAIAIGAAALLHDVRHYEKTGVDGCLIPPRCGRGLGICFLKTPFVYEAVASRMSKSSSLPLFRVRRSCRAVAFRARLSSSSGKPRQSSPLSSMLSSRLIEPSSWFGKGLRHEPA